ncbi:c-type cytochrome [Parerythrobacter lacustris]|uniref:Cytochrome c domain-containing protein n=1 Tax=Parerythrobacter lacustris TaxID=2969984 RepID=A0ABT1XRA7_9SPHN|nr:hypothetical protein [Parerythrobacter lacustris]MCR2834176.1 hypothetical protein [Parerythrobacter lacustris]
MALICERSTLRGRMACLLPLVALSMAAGSCTSGGQAIGGYETPRPPVSMDPPQAQAALPDPSPHRSAPLFEASGYGKCAPCHAHQYRINGIGPHLVGLYGRRIGSVENYRYSEALTSVGGTWDAASLDRFIADPEAFAPGNTMKFRGIESAETRASIIAYLQREARKEGDSEAK